MTAELSTVLDLAERGMESLEWADRDTTAERRAIATVRQADGLQAKAKASPHGYQPDGETIQEVIEADGSDVLVGVFETNSLAYSHRLHWERMGFKSRSERIRGHGTGVYARAVKAAKR